MNGILSDISSADNNAALKAQLETHIKEVATAFSNKASKFDTLFEACGQLSGETASIASKQAEDSDRLHGMEASMQQMHTQLHKHAALYVTHTRDITTTQDLLRAAEERIGDIQAAIDNSPVPEGLAALALRLEKLSAFAEEKDGSDRAFLAALRDNQEDQKQHVTGELLLLNDSQRRIREKLKGLNDYVQVLTDSKDRHQAVLEEVEER